MKSVRSALAGAALAVFAASNASAVPDHLQCIKIKDDAEKAAYAAILTPTNPNFAGAAGCTITLPAKLLCMATEKSAVSPTPPVSDEGDPAGTFLCYKTKCPATEGTATLDDQFGTHNVTGSKTGLVCTAVLPAPVCGDGAIEATEQCDDDDIDGGDGCSPTCQTEHGFQCFGAPSACMAICGDSLVSSAEACDDATYGNGDGCSTMCQVEPGYQCTGEPSVCTPI